MMRFVGIFVLLCMFMAAARMAIVTMTLVFLVSLLWGAYNQPKRVRGFLAMLVLLRVAEVYPATLLIVLIVLVATGRRTKHVHA